MSLSRAVRLPAGELCAVAVLAAASARCIAAARASTRSAAESMVYACAVRDLDLLSGDAGKSAPGNFLAALYIFAPSV